MKHLDLFSGVGGFSLAVDWVWDNVEHVFCDNNLFCQTILKKHWPNSPIYGDIYDLIKELEYVGTATVQKPATKNVRTNYERPFLLTGGFPCQPFSAAGKRKGASDDRFLWPAMLSVIRLSRPRWVVAENVAGLITIGNGMVFEQVCSDLEKENYSVQAFIIPAVSLNAPHRRDRVWIVANRNDLTKGRKSGEYADSSPKERLQKRDEIQRPTEPTGLHAFIENPQHEPTRNAEQRGNDKRPPSGVARPTTNDTNPQGGSWDKNWLETATRLCVVDDGLPGGLARPKGWRNAALKGAGNAIVPAVAAEIMRAIRATEPLEMRV